jgi:SHS family lactate transporter-like MFS transporter
LLSIIIAMSISEPAEPIIKDTLATARQSIGDLFRWKMRMELIGDLGEMHAQWQTPPPLQNPIRLTAQLVTMCFKK